MLKQVQHDKIIYPGQLWNQVRDDSYEPYIARASHSPPILPKRRQGGGGRVTDLARVLQDCLFIALNLLNFTYPYTIYIPHFTNFITPFDRIVTFIYKYLG